MKYESIYLDHINHEYLNSFQSFFFCSFDSSLIFIEHFYTIKLKKKIRDHSSCLIWLVPGDERTIDDLTSDLTSDVSSVNPHPRIRNCYS